MATPQPSTGPVPRTEAEDWLPPDAPLAMPQQVLERARPEEGFFAHIYRLLFAPQRG